jgi:hypothetical protein
MGSSVVVVAVVVVGATVVDVAGTVVADVDVPSPWLLQPPTASATAAPMLRIEVVNGMSPDLPLARGRRGSSRGRGYRTSERELRFRSLGLRSCD